MDLSASINNGNCCCAACCGGTPSCAAVSQNFAALPEGPLPPTLDTGQPWLNWFGTAVGTIFDASGFIPSLGNALGTTGPGDFGSFFLAPFPDCCTGTISYSGEMFSGFWGVSNGQTGPGAKFIGVFNSGPTEWSLVDETSTVIAIDTNFTPTTNFPTGLDTFEFKWHADGRVDFTFNGITWNPTYSPEPPAAPFAGPLYGFVGGPIWNNVLLECVDDCCTAAMAPSDIASLRQWLPCDSFYVTNPGNSSPDWVYAPLVGSPVSSGTPVIYIDEVNHPSGGTTPTIDQDNTMEGGTLSIGPSASEPAWVESPLSGCMVPEFYGVAGKLLPPALYIPNNNPTPSGIGIATIFEPVSDGTIGYSVLWPLAPDAADIWVAGNIPGPDQFVIANGDESAPAAGIPTLTLGQYHSLIVTWDDTTGNGEVWIDGALLVSGNLWGGVPITAASIGWANTGDGAWFFHGGASWDYADSAAAIPAFNTWALNNFGIGA